MHVIQNVLTNYTMLHSDFTGFSVNPSGIFYFFIHILIALIVFTTFYLIGDKLRKLFFKQQQTLIFFINITLGFITIGLGICLLGMLSLLKSEVLLVYFVSILLIAFYPFSFLKYLDRKIILKQTKAIKIDYKDFVVWATILFVIISFLRLISPEIAEDGYHTDLPSLYLSSQTSMHQSKEMLHVIPYPQLAEMTYLIPLFFGDKEATRFIHFGFYVLIILLLYTISKNNKSAFIKFAPLLFATAPVVMKYSSSQYTDFFMLLPFLLSMLLLAKSTTKKSVILSGIMFGAVISIKMWLLVYIPVFLLFIAIQNRKKKLLDTLTLLSFFILAACSIVCIWYLRAFILTGDPVFPIFSKIELLETTQMLSTPVSDHFNFNWKMFTYPNMIVLSPLFFLAFLFAFIYHKTFTKLVSASPLFLFFCLLMLEQLFIKVDFGRYLLAWYTTSTLIASAGVAIVFNKKNTVRYGFITCYVILFIYYLFNAVLLLPYGFGWADKNAYLTRVLGRDNVSYYNFENSFDKWISKKDLVATYGIGSFYYADFAYLDIGYIFSKNQREFRLLTQKKATKLLVKGGDITWFCKKLSLKHCDKTKVKLLATYPSDIKKYNLYELIK